MPLLVPMRKVPVHTILHYLRALLKTHLIQRFAKNKKLTAPQLAIFQPTMKCNFRCTYCDDGSGNMYPYLPEKNRMSTAETKRALELIREASPAISVSGGEVTLRPDVVELFEHMDKIGFAPIGMNTNAYVLDKYIKVLHHIDYLIVSMDSLDHARMDELIDLEKPGQTAKVLENLELAVKYKQEHNLKFDIILNTVIFPETIQDAWDVFEYCNEHGFYWSPMPHVNGKYPNPGLVDNPAYMELLGEVIRVKKKGGKIFGSVIGHDISRNFKRFECYPTFRATVFPNGDVFYPCAPLDQRAANILETGSYEKAIQIGEEKYGPIPYCDNRCHISCYLEGSLLISHPFAGAKEALTFILASRKKVKINRPPKEKVHHLPPPFHELRKMPSLPPELVRQYRSEGRFTNDFTSRIRLTGQPDEPGDGQDKKTNKMTAPAKEASLPA